MTLLITVFAAIISAILWYNKFDGNMNLGALSLMYWGASLMWLVDAIAAYIKNGAEYFSPAAADMLNDAYLGFSAVALGLVIWLITLLIKDPKCIVQKTLSKGR